MGTAPDRAQFRQVLGDLATKTQAKMPSLNGRVEKALKLALAGDVELRADGSASVYSSSDPTKRYEIIEGTCTCRDWAQAPEHLCQHRLSAGLLRKAQALLPSTAPVPEAAAPTLSGIDPRWIVQVSGKPFIRFEGLLHLAHEKGLLELSTTVITVTAELAVCQSTARFQDGLVITDVGDATPQNVQRHLAPHFIRMAATRASARALRRALDIDMVALEELGEE